MLTKTMNLQKFVNENGDEIRDYRTYENGTIMFKFENPERIMDMKRKVAKELDLKVKTCTTGRTYWFEPW